MALEVDDIVSYSSVDLKRIRYSMRHAVTTRGFGVAFSVDAFIDSITGHMLMQVDREVWAEYPKTVTFTHPADWWQAVRARWCPAWWLKRYPVVEKVDRVEVDRLYPNMAIAGEKSTLRVVATHGKPWRG